MVIRLTGVLEDGSPRAAWVPVDTRTPVTIQAGDSVEVQLRAVTAAGVPLRLAGGDSIVMDCRESTIRPSRPYFVVAAVAAPDLGDGWYRITIPYSTSQYLGGLRGVYGIRRVRSGYIDTLIGTSAIHFTGAAASASGSPVVPVPPVLAPQDGTERSFSWTAVSTGTTQVVTIPGGMVDPSFAIASFLLREPAPGDGTHPDATFPTVGRTTTTFTVLTDSPIRAGSIYDVVLRDRGV